MKRERYWALRHWMGTADGYQSGYQWHIGGAFGTLHGCNLKPKMRSGNWPMLA